MGPADGKNPTNPTDWGIVVKVRDEDTAGGYSVQGSTIPPGSPGPRPHVHRRREEAYYVLDGELTVRVGPRKTVAPLGSFVVVPRGVLRTSPPIRARSRPGYCSSSPFRDGGLFEEAAERRKPPRAVPSDPAVLQKLEAFTEKYGYEFAELPAEM